MSQFNITTFEMQMNKLSSLILHSMVWVTHHMWYKISLIHGCTLLVTNVDHKHLSPSTRISLPSPAPLRNEKIFTVGDQSCCQYKVMNMLLQVYLNGALKVHTYRKSYLHSCLLLMLFPVISGFKHTLFITDITIMSFLLIVVLQHVCLFSFIHVYFGPM
jgi:hypothetical protein